MKEVLTFRGVPIVADAPKRENYLVNPRKLAAWARLVRMKARHGR